MAYMTEEQELKNGIKNVSPKHDAMIEWMLLNPTAKQKDMAAAFGVTQSWLSLILHSDAFESAWRAAQGEFRTVHVMPLRAKLLGVAHQAVDRLAETVSEVDDAVALSGIADKLLGKLGYGTPQTAVNVTNYVSSVTAEEMQAAREAQKRYRATLVAEGEGEGPLLLELTG